MAVYNFDRIRSRRGSYAFTTDKGTEYEVTFTPIKNIFSYNVAFGVLNDEFEGEDYVITNRGEVFSVMQTIIEVLKAFKLENLHVKEVVFSGEPRSDEDENMLSKRSKIFLRYVHLLQEEWVKEINIQGNRISLTFKDIKV